MRMAVVATLVVFIAGTAKAQSLGSMEIANQLGSVLAAEQFCGLSYNKTAISKFIDAKVSAKDMGFAPMLETMVAGAKFQQNGMSQSLKTAHCRQINRVAKAYGFIN